MLLALGWDAAGPTHVMKALRALEVRAATLNHDYWHAALWVWTAPRAVFDEELV